MPKSVFTDFNGALSTPVAPVLVVHRVLSAKLSDGQSAALLGRTVGEARLIMLIRKVYNRSDRFGPRLAAVGRIRLETAAPVRNERVRVYDIVRLMRKAGVGMARSGHLRARKSLSANATKDDERERLQDLFPM